MRTSVEMIGPERAKEFLACSAGNRSLRKTHIAYLAKEMKDGNWILTSETVKFDANGVLIDGHHRMNAIIESGATASFFVAYDESISAKRVIDSNLPRNLADHTGIDKNTVEIINASFAVHSRIKARKISPSDAEDFYLANMEWLEFVKSARHKSGFGISRAAVWLAIGEYYKIDKVNAKEFSDSYRLSGGYVQQACMLRDFVIRNNRPQAGGSLICFFYERAVYCIKKHIQGKNVVRLFPERWDWDKKELSKVKV